MPPESHEIPIPPIPDHIYHQMTDLVVELASIADEVMGVIIEDHPELLKSPRISPLLIRWLTNRMASNAITRNLEALDPNIKEKAAYQLNRIEEERRKKEEG